MNVTTYPMLQLAPVSPTNSEFSRDIRYVQGSENCVGRVEINSTETLQFIFIYYFFYCYLYIFSPDSQESDGGAIHRVSNYPDLLPKMPRYCCPLVI